MHDCVRWWVTCDVRDRMRQQQQPCLFAGTCGGQLNEHWRGARPFVQTSPHAVHAMTIHQQSVHALEEVQVLKLAARQPLLLLLLLLLSSLPSCQSRRRQACQWQRCRWQWESWQPCWQVTKKTKRTWEWPELQARAVLASYESLAVVSAAVALRRRKKTQTRAWWPQQTAWKNHLSVSQPRRRRATATALGDRFS